MVKERARAKVIIGMLHRKAAGDMTLGNVPPRVRSRATILGKPHPRGRKEVAMILDMIVATAAAMTLATTAAMTLAMTVAKGKAKARASLPGGGSPSFTE